MLLADEGGTAVFMPCKTLTCIRFYAAYNLTALDSKAGVISGGEQFILQSESN